MKSAERIAAGSASHVCVMDHAKVNAVLTFMEGNPGYAKIICEARLILIVITNHQ